MKILLVLSLGIGALHAQYVTIQGSDYPANSRGQLNLKPASRVGSGAPSGACTAGLDLYLDLSSSLFYGCPAGSWVGFVSASTTGNAATAITLQTARTIAGVSFDGSAAIAIPSTGLSDTAGLVRGAANLPTTGAIPYVSAPGVLSQDTLLNWNSVDNRLSIGTSNSDSALNLEDAQYIGWSAAGAKITGASGVGFGVQISNDWALIAASPTRNILIGTATEGNFKLDVANSGSAGTFRAYDARATIGNTLAVVRAGAGQVGNLQEWQNAFGVFMARVENSGRISTTNTFLIDTTTGVVFSGLAATLGSYSRGVAIGYNNQSDGIVHATAFVFPGTTSTTTTLGIAKNGTDTVEINNGTAGTFRDLRVQKTQTSVVAVASLGTCNAAAEGSRWGVTDALAPVSLAIVAGGGAVRVATYCNGTNWIVQ